MLIFNIIIFFLVVTKNNLLLYDVFDKLITVFDKNEFCEEKKHSTGDFQPKEVRKL